MKKSIVALATAATFTGVMAGTASAQEYEVNKGDTLWGISHNFDTTVDNLKNWNDLTSNIIYPEQRLTVKPEKHHTVKEDETLWGIALQNEVTVDQLMSWNKLTTDLIHPGDDIVIYPSEKSNKSEIKNDDKQAPAAPAKEESSSAQPSAPAPKEESKPAATASDSNVAKEITMKATGYTANCDGCSGTTATGLDLKANPDAKVISVDPSVIPLGSKVYVEGYGYATAADTGGAIKGNRIDIFFPSKDQAINWGVRTVKVKVLK
ncbi:LysM peptidoglycan-binding and 3D domain-containing protein [Falsibacillus albus]|uniref:LysM peptidoglycan-binding domain-containing protein n=1 Tax=Falsibacillus albus TaxID=2478915 RepID=A0A3L7JZF2_9BACI|nr:3D domain-containing protein [Falsibacillus albus]RLQ96187.1 LysM peptidoglycan-binding domain-containing protein [Falsibacillus albus]